MTNLTVKSKKDYIVTVSGNHKFMLDEIVIFENDVRGLVISSKDGEAQIALFEDKLHNQVMVGMKGKATGASFEVKVSEDQQGTIIDVGAEILVDPMKEDRVLIDPEGEMRNVFRIGRPIYTRDFVNRTLITGTAAIDWAIPIAKGQRELILGDRKTGKTSIALNMILSQKDTNVKCVYVSIGQKKTDLMQFISKVQNAGMLERTTIVAALADDTSTMKYLAPYVGTTLAEYLQEKNGDDVLIIYDDLSKHADAYRELSLLLETAPAREAYPGDIFYLHSKLLERAGAFSKEYGGGSITAIPVIQTEGGDITSYIPTNVISITDGQIFTSKEMFNAQIKPAINIPYSVSRVGSSAQSGSVKKFSSGIKLQVSQYEEVKKLQKMSSSTSKENAEIIANGEIMSQLLQQADLEVLEYDLGALLLILLKKGYLKLFNKAGLDHLKQVLRNYLKSTNIGQKMSELLLARSVNVSDIDVYIQLEIAPLVKFILLRSNPELEQTREFQDTFRGIRNESRVIMASERSDILGGNK